MQKSNDVKTTEPTTIDLIERAYTEGWTVEELSGVRAGTEVIALDMEGEIVIYDLPQSKATSNTTEPACQLLAQIARENVAIGERWNVDFVEPNAIVVTSDESAKVTEHAFKAIIDDKPIAGSVVKRHMAAKFDADNVTWQHFQTRVKGEGKLLVIRFTGKRAS